MAKVTKALAMRDAKQLARERECTYYVILANDGEYFVAPTKPMIQNINGTRDVTRVDPDGYTYYA